MSIHFNIENMNNCEIQIHQNQLLFKYDMCVTNEIYTVEEKVASYSFSVARNRALAKKKQISLIG